MAGKGQLDVGSSTITRNVASTTAANLVSDIGSVTVANSIVGEPRSVSGLTIASCYSAAGIQSGGYNLMTDATCKLTALSDRIAPTTGVGPLANNTGPLAGTGSYAKVPDTMLPVAGGPAVDQIPSLTLSPDERGVSRPVGPKADIGSVERRLVAPY